MPQLQRRCVIWLRTSLTPGKGTVSIVNTAAKTELFPGCIVVKAKGVWAGEGQSIKKFSAVGWVSAMISLVRGKISVVHGARI